MKSCEAGKNGMLGTIHLLARDGNFAVADELSPIPINEIEMWLDHATETARLIDEVEADEYHRDRKNGDAVEYFEAMAYREMEAEVWKTKVLRGTREVYSRTTHRSGKKRDKFALWVGRNSQPKSGLLPNSRVADRLNRIADRGGKPPKRLRRYNGYRAEYGQAIFMKQLEQSIAKINEVLAE